MKIFTVTTALILALGFSTAFAQETPTPPQIDAPSQAPATPAIQPAQPAEPSTAEPEERNIRLNFRGVPLDMVLNYLSEAVGLIVVMETKVEGKVDVWSQQPVSKSEAIELLNTVLNKNGYAAIRNGRMLTIVSRDNAKKRDLPVRSGADPEEIPKSDQMVTHIIPVRYANAVQMVRDLQPLLPEYAILTANESGNSLVLTDTQANVRRMTEIVNALDTSISSISTVRVFALRFADANELADVVKELFEPPTTNSRSTSRGGFDPRQFMQRFGGGPGGGDGGRGGGPGGGGSSGNDSDARRAASRIVAVADERTNSLIVSAPEEYIPTIEQLVREIDTDVMDVTELRVFRLKYSDPIEMADVLAELFPDETQQNGNRGESRFPGFFGGRGPNRNATAQQSERMKKMGRVVAVPDQRTSSVIVSAASELMSQIALMIEQLDSDPAKKQKVFVYSLENADVQNVEEILRGMFESQTLGNRNNRNQNSQLNQNPLNTRNTGNNGLGTGIGGNRTGGGNTGQNFR